MFDRGTDRMLQQVERVVLNALAMKCGLPPETCAYRQSLAMVFGETDPPEERAGANSPSRVPRKPLEFFFFAD
jgi:hypothetical protein